MTHAVFPASLFVLASLTPALGAEKSFDVSGFSHIEARAGITVEVVQGDAYSVTAEGTARGVRGVTVARRGDVLVISRHATGLARFSLLFGGGKHPAVVHVSLPELREVTALAGADVAVTGTAEDSFVAHAKAGADLTLSDVSSHDVKLTAAAGADLSAQGRCGALKAQASSGAGLSARGLDCASAKVSVSSGADISVTAETVSAMAHSGGAVDVWGAQKLDATSLAGGDVTRHN